MLRIGLYITIISLFIFVKPSLGQDTTNLYYHNLFELNKSNPDKIISLATEYYDNYLWKELQSIKEFVSLLNNISNESHIPLLKPLGNLIYGKALIYKGEFTEAISYLDEALFGFTELSNDELLAELYNSYGICYLLQNNQNLAETYFNKSKDICIKNNYNKLLIAVNNNLARTFIKNDPNKALNFLYENENIANKHNIKNYEITTKFLIIYALINLDKLKDAKIILNDIKPEILKRKKEIELLEYSFFLGKIEIKQNNLNLALNHLKSAEAYLNFSDIDTKIELYFDMATTFQKLSMSNQAKEYFKKIVSTNKTNHPTVGNTFRLLSDEYYKLSKYDSAYKYLSLYTKFKTEEYEKKLNNEIQNLLKNTEVANHQLNLQNELLATKEKEYRTQSFILFFSIIAIIVLIIFLVIFIRSSTKNYDLTQKLKQEIEHSKEYQKKLEEYQKQIEESNNFKTAIIRNMTHEIRTPFNGLLGFISLIKRKALSINDEELIEYSTFVDKSSHRIYELVSNLNDLSLLESGEYNIRYGICHLPDLINDAYFGYINECIEKDIELKIENIDNIIIETDSNSLSKALKNVVDNAVKFTHKGYVKIYTHLIDRNLTITVEDTGIGMSPESIENIGIPFKQLDMSITRNYEGIGLGLAVTKKIINKLNGRLEIKSKLNVGTKISFVFENITVRNDLI